MNELFNKILISTQPAESFPEFERALAKSGAFLYNFPMITVIEAEINIQQENILKNISLYNWLVFTSKNGVKYFIKKLEKITGTSELPDYVKIAVIGNKTAQELLKNGITPDYVSKSNFAETFSKELKKRVIPKGSNVLLLLGNLAGNIIEDALRDDVTICRVNCYDTIAPETDNPELIKKIKSGKYNLIIFTSSSCFSNFAEILKKHHVKFKNLRVASIGKATTKTMQEYGVFPVLTAKQSNIEGLVHEIKTFFKPKF